LLAVTDEACSLLSTFDEQPMNEKIGVAAMNAKTSARENLTGSSASKILQNNLFFIFILG
jgi:hypothetical protein